MKKKLVFVIDSDLYIRNYFETGFLKKLSKIHNIFFIFSKEVNNKSYIKKNKKFLGYYSTSNLKKEYITYLITFYYGNLEKDLHHLYLDFTDC